MLVGGIVELFLGDEAGKKGITLGVEDDGGLLPKNASGEKA